MWKMRKFCALCCFLQLHAVVGVDSQKTELDNPLAISLLRAFRQFTYDVFGRTGAEGGRLLDEARNLNKVQSAVPETVDFPCRLAVGRSSEVPTSVNRLRPGDIDVVAAMGDSLTAGAGVFATNLLHIVIENRGVTATGGGQRTWREYLTIPNILKVFNKNLVGYALGDSLTLHKESQLNVAESGAMSFDMPFMAKTLIKRIKNDPRIDFEKHWKLVSIMIGANDFCTNVCWSARASSILEKHRSELLETLRILRDDLPRTFVNLIPPPNLKALVDSREGRYSIKCDITTNAECSCLFGLKYQTVRPRYYEIMKRWQDLEEKIVTYPEFEKEDFAVIFQPVTAEMTVPKAPDGYADMTYLSEDCFHITQKSNARFANGLWNNMLEPVGNKSRNWEDLFARFLCPTPEMPYLFTSANSRNLNA